MHQRHRAIFPAGLIALLFTLSLIAACAPLADPAPDPPTDQEQTRARLSELKQQLQGLQEELARAKAEQAAAGQASNSPAAGPAWTALTATTSAPPGYARYAYLLLMPKTKQQESLALMTLLDALPERDVLSPGERTLLLVPVVKPEIARLDPESYDQGLAEQLLSTLNVRTATWQGPLLAVADRQLDDPAAHILAIDLAGRPPAFVQAVLALLQQPAASGEVPQKLLLPLIELAGNAPSLVSRSGRVWRLSWPQ
jgi:hypothetical protein